MATCSQCEKRPAIYSQGGHLLCLSCYATIRDLELREEQLMQQRSAMTASTLNYLTEMMQYQVGFRPTPPTLHVPQPISAAFNTGDHMNINIEGSSVGLLNTGQMKDIHTIRVNLGALAGKEAEVAEALKSVTEAVAGSSDLNEEQRTAALDQLAELSKQANLAPEERSKGVLRAVVATLSNSLSAAGSAAEVWGTWGPTIIGFFGL